MISLCLSLHNRNCFRIGFSTVDYCYCEVCIRSEKQGAAEITSPIWEANKFKTIEDKANVFFYFWRVHRMPFYINVF